MRLRKENMIELDDCKAMQGEGEGDTRRRDRGTVPALADLYTPLPVGRVSASLFGVANANNEIFVFFHFRRDLLPFHLHSDLS